MFLREMRSPWLDHPQWLGVPVSLGKVTVCSPSSQTRGVAAPLHQGAEVEVKGG